MHRKAKAIYNVTLLALLLTVTSIQMTYAQAGTGSGNMTFSPYTMYGIGDLIAPGTASTLSMGGVGLGMRTPLEINYLNPASLSAISPQTSLFSFGGRSNFATSKTPQTKTGYSSMDLSDVGFAIPLSRGVGLSFSLTPVSAVGYNSTMIGEQSEITEGVGRSLYSYTGDGGISQATMGLGVMIIRGFSVGASLNYNFGNINRYNSVEILPLLGQATPYRAIKIHENTHISHAVINLGTQYSWRVGSESALTLGATYQIQTTANTTRKIDKLATNGNIVDTISSFSGRYPITLPAKLSAGLYYVSSKVSLGFDYSRQDWSNAFELGNTTGIGLGTQSDYKIGLSYCPDLTSLNSMFKRWTYKIGAHYSQSYLIKDGEKLNNYGITAGVDIPMLRTARTAAKGYSKISLGIDIGRRGSYKIGQVQETYYKGYVGLSLFGGDYWFVKQKFQ